MMTNKFLFSSLLLAVVLVMTGCNKNNSSYSIEDIEGKAKIVGCLTYHEGQEYVDGKFIEKVVVGANKAVYVDIKNSDLSPNRVASGYQTYTTITDEEGNFEIEVPAFRNGINVTVRAEDFLGTRKLLKSWKNGSPVFEDTDVLFKIEKNIEVSADRITLADMQYGFEERDIDLGFLTSVPLKIRVGEGQVGIRREGGQEIGEPTPDEPGDDDDQEPTDPTPEPGYYADYYFVAKSGANAVISVEYTDEIDAETGLPIVRKYGATTESAGEATINIPTREEKCTLNITLEVIPYTSQLSYPQIGENEGGILYGIYKQYGNSSFVSETTKSITFEGFESTENLITNNNTMTAKMVLQTTSEHKTTYSPSGYSGVKY